MISKVKVALSSLIYAMLRSQWTSMCKTFGPARDGRSGIPAERKLLKK